ncbi:MAG TPA: hypothetical protein VGF82_16535 [Terracidiphilus sp.]|jgi:hypothetical protein
MESRPDKKSSDLIANSNQIGVDFLRTDLDAGLTFVSVAKTTTCLETRARNFSKALKAYETVLRFLPRVTPSVGEQTEIMSKLEDLRADLERAGFPCQS